MLQTYTYPTKRLKSVKTVTERIFDEDETLTSETVTVEEEYEYVNESYKPYPGYPGYPTYPFIYSSVGSNANAIQ